jgi:hypothetical protein
MHRTGSAADRRLAVISKVIVVAVLSVFGTGVPAHAQGQPQGTPLQVQGDPTDDGLRWIRVEGSSVALERNGETVWRFGFDPELTHPAFHPLALPGGRALTLDRPSDHLHHHGLWFSWKYINGVNFWENAPSSDRPAGRTEWTAPTVELGNDGSARFELPLTYRLPDDQVVMTENRVLEVSPVGADGSFSIDWSSRFESVADEVILDRTPLPGEPGGKVWGGYAGLSARLVQLEERAASTLQGTAEFNAADRFRGRSNGFDYSGMLDGEAVGIAILSDPGNLNAPSPWSAIRSGVMTFFTPAVLCYAPHRMERGEGFDLRYRVVVHPGRWGAEDLTEAFTGYVGALEADEPAGIDDQELKR